MNNNSAIVIKFGGEVVESVDQLANLASSIKELHTRGEKLILVHGGGPIASKLSKRLGLEPKMVGGRRVTCTETLEVMKMVLPGIVNSNVIAILNGLGIPAVSVSGISCIDAEKRPPKVVSGSDGKMVDFGHVGDVKDIKPKLLNDLLDNGYIPVVSPLSADATGNMLNINADTIASEIAKKVNAKDLVLITAIGGVYRDIDDKQSKFSQISLAEGKNLINEGIIQGGMIPKLEEGFKLLEKNLNAFHIVGTNTKECVLKEIEKPGSIGTAIVK